MSNEIKTDGGLHGDPPFDPADGSGPALTRKQVVLEGRLELQRVAFHPPAECRHNCDMHLRPWLCGIARTETGATNIAVLEMYLEALEGKYVRITIEAEEHNAPGEPQPTV